MKKRFFSFITVFMLLMSCLCIQGAYASGNMAVFYVSVSGSSDGDGSFDNPFASIEQARDAIRGLSEYPSGGVAVLLRGGTYKIKNTISFSATDSGKENAPIIYQAYKDEEVRFSGTKELDSSKWTAVSSQSVRSILPASAKDKVVEMNLSYLDEDLGTLCNLSQSEGFRKSPPWAELIIDDEIMTMSRYPNKGEFLYTYSITANDDAEGTSFTYNDSFLSGLTNEKNLYAMGWYENYYFCNFEKVKSVSPGNVNLERNVKAKSDHPFYFVNSPAFIDIPGEYYIDFDAKMLYYYPVSDVKASKAEITSSTKSMLSMTNVSDVIFRNIIFEGSRSSLGNANGCKRIIFDKCIMRNFGSSFMSFMDSKDCMIANSELYNSGLSMMNITGGNKSTLEDGNFRLINNEIHETGRLCSSYYGVWWCHDSVGNGTVGFKVSHNKIYDVPTFIGMIGTNTLFEYNDVSRCSYQAADMAALYYGSHTRPGVNIQYNYFHDITLDFKCKTGFGTNAIYLDGAQGARVYGNVVQNVHRNMYYCSAGGSNTVKNNIFIGNPTAESYSEFPTSTQSIRVAGYDIEKTAEYAKSVFEPYVYSESSPWAKAFPHYIRNMEANQPYMDDHIIENNLMYNCGPMAITESCLTSPYTSIKNNWETTKDPGFVDAKNGNYQLKADSEVFTKIPGFEMIDMSKIGLLDEDYDTGFYIDYNALSSSSSVNGVVLKINSPKAMSNGAEVYVDKYNMAVTPVIVDSRTLVPVRFISEAFGAKVGWNGDTRQVAVVYGDKTVIMQIDSQTFTVNGEANTMDVPPMILEGRTVIPIRALTEALGKKVFWDPQGLIVISDTADTLDSTADAALITELLTKLSQ